MDAKSSTIVSLKSQEPNTLLTKSIAIARWSFETSEVKPITTFNGFMLLILPNQAVAGVPLRPFVCKMQVYDVCKMEFETTCLPAQVQIKITISFSFYKCKQVNEAYMRSLLEFTDCFVCPNCTSILYQNNSPIPLQFT